LALAVLIDQGAQAALPVPWVPKDADEAAIAASAPVVPVRSLQLRPSFAILRSGGTLTTLVIRTDLPMRYVLVPGLRLGNVYSIVRVDLPAIMTLDTPRLHASGLGDITAFDSAIKPFRWGVVLAGFAMIVPSATRAALGLGQLQLAPTGGFAVKAARHFGFAVLWANFFGVTGATRLRSIDALAVQPYVVLTMPKAFFLLSDPIWTFDWNRKGHATIPINLAVGHAFSAHLALDLQPEWVATGDGQNNVLIRANLDYLGW
jgi:hypothetical protein